MASVTRDLFGGAITAVLPSRLIDASYVLTLSYEFYLPFFSNIRQIPDTQEVFLYPESNVSIIVEILERVAPTTFAESIRLTCFLHLQPMLIHFLTDFTSCHWHMTTRLNLLSCMKFG
jgi:hypothetical protein